LAFESVNGISQDIFKVDHFLLFYGQNRSSGKLKLFRKNEVESEGKERRGGREGGERKIGIVHPLFFG